MQTNAIKTIKAYKLYWSKKEDNIYSWVFDDPAVGLIREAFVSGADLVCDALAEEVGREDVVLQFSEFRFPAAKFLCTYVRGDVTSGTTYWAERLGIELWLCPALNKYFAETPDTIYVNYF